MTPLKGKSTRRFREQNTLALKIISGSPFAGGVVDRVTGELKLVAIANADASFSLPDLIAQHGEPEIVGVFNGNEHHFFASHGLAIVATGRAESDILYVQVLPETMSLNDYIAVNGYAAETFVFASP